MTDTPRYHVYLSYHEQDETAARLIAERLRTEYGIEPWLRAWSAIPGRLTQEEQERGLAESTACAVLIGAAGVRQWQQLDVYAAIRQRVETEGGNFPVIPVFLPLCPAEAQEAMPAMLRLFEPVHLMTLDDQPGLARLAAGVRGEPALSASITLPDEPAPYRGLLPFEAEHARFFFGRDDDVRRLVEKLGQQRFVAVVGASGSGKSSLVMAGLLPKLAENALPDSARWKVQQMTPGSEPLRSLANQLATLAPPGTDRLQAADALVERLAAQQNGMRSATAAYLADDPRPLLLFVDQFEELFTQCQEEPERCRAQAEQFVANLADAVQQGGGRIRVLITLRADFLDRCLASPTLRRLLEDRQVLLGPMDEPALREAIVRPAQAVGALFEKGLVNVILRDVGDEPGRLPLLEHALHELWLARRGPWLAWEAYEETGGVQGALNRRAQATYDALDAEQQRIARNIFLRLTALGEGVADTGRRAQREELYTVGAARDEVDVVVQALAGSEARLLVVDGDNVQVAHEALIQGWETLRGWLEANRDALRVQRRLTDAATEWEARGKEADYLYRGARLAEVVECLAGDESGLNEVETAFVRVSVEMREREGVEQGAQRQRELEQAHKLAEMERLRAEEAEAAARRARAGELALYARTELAEKTDPSGSLALILARDAVLATWRPGEGTKSLVTVNADRVLRDAVDSAPPHRMTLRHHGPNSRVLVLSAAYSPDGAQIVTASDDGTARIWDVNSGQELRTLRGHTDRVNSASYSPDGQQIVTASDDGTARIWDAISGQGLLILNGHTHLVKSAAYSPDGAQIVTASDDGTARIWDVDSGQELRALRGHTDRVKSASYSPDGQQIVTASADRTVYIWNAASGQVVHNLRGHNGWSNSAAFSPDGQQIVTASDDEAALICSEDSGRIVGVLSGHTGWVITAAFSPDGTQIVTASDDGTARMWDAHSGHELLILSGHSEGVNSAAYSPNGAQIVTASDDGTARIWDTKTGQELRTLRGHTKPVNSAAFSPDGRQIVTASDDSTALIWITESCQIVDTLSGHSGGVNSAAFSPDGNQIVTASNDRTARIWDANSGQELLILNGHTDRVKSATFSPDGSQIVTTSNDRTARIWDANSGQELLILNGHTDRVNSAVYNPYEGHIVTASWDGTARIWDAKSGQELCILGGHSGGVWSAAYNPNGKRIVTASYDGTARIWDAENDQELSTFIRWGEPLWFATYSPDGQHIVIASYFDLTAHIWTVEGCQVAGTISGHTGCVRSAVYSPNGRQIVTASDDGTARIWIANIDDLLAEASRLIQRDPPLLTPEERQRFGFE